MRKRSAKILWIIKVSGKCSWKEDRDINASKNIYERGITAAGHAVGAFGDDVRPSARKAVADELGTIRGVSR